MQIWLQLLVIFLTLTISAGLGAPLIGVLLDRVLKSKSEATTTKGPPVTEELLSGGTWIGIIERLATTLAVVCGQPALIAVIVAVKGFGRFDQLKGNPAASEKFVIGTLTSLLWAALIGAAAGWVLALA